MLTKQIKRNCDEHENLISIRIDVENITHSINFDVWCFFYYKRIAHEYYYKNVDGLCWKKNQINYNYFNLSYAHT